MSPNFNCVILLLTLENLYSPFASSYETSLLLAPDDTLVTSSLYTAKLLVLSESRLSTLSLSKSSVVLLRKSCISFVYIVDSYIEHNGDIVSSIRNALTKKYCGIVSILILTTTLLSDCLISAVPIPCISCPSSLYIPTIILASPILSNSTSALVPVTVTSNILYPLLFCTSVLLLNLSAISFPIELSDENTISLYASVLFSMLSDAYTSFFSISNVYAVLNIMLIINVILIIFLIIFLIILTMLQKLYYCYNKSVCSTLSLSYIVN